jgi:hypothetical protein
MAPTFHHPSLLPDMLGTLKGRTIHDLVQMPFALLMTFILLMPCATAQGQDQSAEELFFKANQAYKNDRYQEAIEGYNQLIQTGFESGHVYFNLGNAYFRENKLGRAILYYERAKILLPRDADLAFNLGYARDQTQDAIADARSAIMQTFFWINNLTFGELLWSFTFLNIVLWGTLLIRLFIKPEWTDYGMIIFLILWSIAGLSFGLKWYQMTTDDRAVILQKEVNVMAGPDSGDTILFRLHEGAVIHQEREEDEWALIRLPDNKRGWVKKNVVEKISNKKSRGEYSGR